MPLLEMTALTDEDLLQQEVDEASDADEDDAGTYGSIYNWSNADHLGGMGLLHVVLSLILLSGRSLPDSTL